MKPNLKLTMAENNMGPEQIRPSIGNDADRRPSARRAPAHGGNWRWSAFEMEKWKEDINRVFDHLERMTHLRSHPGELSSRPESYTEHAESLISTAFPTPEPIIQDAPIRSAEPQAGRNAPETPHPAPVRETSPAPEAAS